MFPTRNLCTMYSSLKEIMLKRILKLLKIQKKYCVKPARLPSRKYVIPLVVIRMCQPLPSYIEHLLSNHLPSRRKSYLGKKILSTRISKVFHVFPMDRKVRMKRNVNPPIMLMLKIFQGQNFLWLLYKCKQMKILKERR